MNFIGYLAGGILGALSIYTYNSLKSPKLKTIGTANDIVQYFIKKGLSINQAVGIAGNIQAESNFNSLASGDNGTAFGIAQWRGDRLQNLKYFASDQKSDFKDFNLQLDFIVFELLNHEKRAFQKLKESDTVELATLNFAKYYERPQASTIPKRVMYSKEIIKSYI